MLKANADLVLTNVVARDAKTGEIVKGLKQSDFKIFENGKEQAIDTFDFESVDMATPLNEATVSGLAAGPTGNGSKAVVVAKPEELRNHRLIVMFFDLTSMQPEDLERAVDAAQTFLRTKMQPADLVALVSLGDTLSVDQDFTADKNALINEVGAYNGTEGQGFAQGANANSNQVEDTTAYTPDESEYNDLNTDRELFALRAVSKSLEKINEKKSLLYFSGGISRDGIENEASLRSAINSAVRADLAIYSVDTRGLQAIGPLGDASTGSLRGQGAFNGGALMNNMNQNFATQEVMATLSTDTGGTAFFDSNDFAPAFAKVQADTSAYYAIGFHSSNLARDGKYRKLTVKIDRPGIKLEYRPGYYAPADFKHSGKEDREQELRGSALERSARHRHGRLHGRHVLPPRRQPLLHAGFARRARLANSHSSKAATKTKPRSTSSAPSSTRPSAPWAASATPSSSTSTRPCMRGKKTSSTPPASICRPANTRSNSSCAKIRPAAWAHSSPMSRCPISKKLRSR